MLDLTSLNERITVEDVKVIMEILGADYVNETDTEIKYRTICHCGGHKHKLYFYKESMTFYCYSECGRIGSIIDLVKKVKEFDNVYDAGEWICNKLGISIIREGSFGEAIDTVRIDDWNYINFLKGKQNKETKKHEFEVLDDKILNMFQNFHPLEWVQENITNETMDVFEIGYCAWQERIVIPHRDKDSNLIGIRGRSFSDDSMMFGKYTPLLTGSMTGKVCYAHTLSDNLYGLHLNKDCIKRTRKILLVEAEKSVLQCASFFGLENNFALGLCGSNLSKRQIELILELNPLEVIVGLDRQFEQLDSDECKQWERKILEKFVKPLSPYTKVSVIWDDRNLLDYKDSPTDRGKTTFLELFNSRQVGRCYGA